MNRRSMLISAGACLVPLRLLAATQPRPAGTWTAVLNLGSTHLPLRLDITGAGQATLFSLDQGNQPIAGQLTANDAGSLRIEFASIGAVYVARFHAPDRIEGTLQQGGSRPLVFLRGELGLADPIAPLGDGSLAKLLRDCGAPAMAAVATKRAGETRIWVAGKRSIGLAPRVTLDDQWHLGSNTKSITATLVARLVDAGCIPWSLRVGDVLADVAPDMQSNYRDATLRHLLSHRAGLPADLSALQLLSFTMSGERDLRGQRRRYSRFALALAPAGPIESTYLYSNNGYVIAAAMLESVLGTSWEDLMRAHVFAPLGLASAGFGPPDAGLFGPARQPLGHTADLDAKLLTLFTGGIRPVRPGLGETTDNPAVLGPAGRVHMNMADLATYLSAHRDRGDFLRPESWAALHTAPFGGDYALGWMLRKDGVLWHNGSNTFWYAEMLVDRARGVASAAACNEARAPAQVAVGNALLRAAVSV